MSLVTLKFNKKPVRNKILSQAGLKLLFPSMKLVHYRAVEILVENAQSSVKLFRSVQFCILELIFLTEGLVFVDTERMIWQNLYSLEHPVSLEMLSEGTDVLLEVADSRHRHIAHPERTSVLLQPLGRPEGLAVASACQLFMPFRINLLAVQKNEVSEAEQLFHSAVPYASVRIQTHMYALFLETLYQRDELGSLSCRLSSGKSDTATLPEEWLLVYGHLHDFFNLGNGTSLEGYGVGICAVKAAERAALQKNDEP